MKYLIGVSILCLSFGLFSCVKVNIKKTVSVEIHLLNDSESTVKLSDIECAPDPVAFYPSEIILSPQGEWHTTNRVGNHDIICFCPLSVIISSGEHSIHQSLKSPTNGICNLDNFIRTERKGSTIFTFTITDALLADWFKTD